MFDTALNDQFPSGAAAYAAYVDGGLGNQPNYAYIVSAFPKAQHLSIALFAANNADALDVEAGASAAFEIPGWYARQVQRGTTDPTVTEAELQSGQLTMGSGAYTVIAVPPGTAHHIALGIDNQAQNQPAARLRVAFFDTAWRVHGDVVVDGAKGLAVLAFPDPAKTGVVSVRRNDAGLAAVGYVIY